MKFQHHVRKTIFYYNYKMSTPPMLQNSVQFELLNKFRTGDPIYDAIISTIVFSSVAYIVSLVPTFFGYVNRCFTRFIPTAFDKFVKIITRKKKSMHKEVIIDYITDTKKVNELFQAVQYYVSNDKDIDYFKETPLKLTYENKIDRETTSLDSIKSLQLNKLIIHNKTKEFTFKGFKINYYVDKKIIDIYTDKERKKENYTVTLSTTIPENCKIDILNDFCTHCMTEYIKSIIGKAWEQLIYINKNGKWESQKSGNKRKIDTIILRTGIKDDIMNDLQTFLKSEEWYNTRDIPYTRGYLFYGKPGTGKTSLIKGISTLCRRHIHFLILRDIKDDNELLDLMRQINYHETILVIEDVDCTSDIIKNRNKKDKEATEKMDELEKKLEMIQNEMKKDKDNGHQMQQSQPMTQSNRITLSGLLNSIDGVFNNDGRILIMTTNHPEVLDEALIRPGRIDRKILFDNCDKQQIIDLYEVFFGEKCDETLLENLGDIEFSPAYITSRFLRFRNNPRGALENLNKSDDHPDVESMIKNIHFKTPSPKITSNDFSSFGSVVRGGMSVRNPAYTPPLHPIETQDGNEIFNECENIEMQSKPKINTLTSHGIELVKSSDELIKEGNLLALNGFNTLKKYIGF